MAGSGNACSAGTFLQKLGLQPVTKCSLTKFYAPALGVASYTAMSVDVMNPNFINVFRWKNMTNFLLAVTLFGTGSYIYTREHMKNSPKRMRALYSVTGAVLLSFGSVLIWAVLRAIIPPNPALSTVAGVGTGLTLLKISSSYLQYVDGQIAKK